MARSTLRSIIFPVLFIACAGAQSVCEQLMAGTWQFPERRSSETNTCRAEPDKSTGAAKIFSRADGNASEPTNSTTLWLIKDIYKGETFFE